MFTLDQQNVTKISHRLHYCCVCGFVAVRTHNILYHGRKHHKAVKDFSIDEHVIPFEARRYKSHGSHRFGKCMEADPNVSIHQNIVNYYRECKKMKELYSEASCFVHAVDNEIMGQRVPAGCEFDSIKNGIEIKEEEAVDGTMTVKKEPVDDAYDASSSQKRKRSPSIKQEAVDDGVKIKHEPNVSKRRKIVKQTTELKKRKRSRKQKHPTRTPEEVLAGQQPKPSNNGKEEAEN